MLGAEQEQWVSEGFKQSNAAWNLLAKGQLAANLKQKSPSGEIDHWTDGWEGYPAARQRILDATGSTQLGNPVFIGGDTHSYWTTDLKADFANPASATVATEFVGTSITSDLRPTTSSPACCPRTHM